MNPSVLPIRFGLDARKRGKERGLKASKRHVGMECYHCEHLQRFGWQFLPRRPQKMRHRHQQMSRFTLSVFELSSPATARLHFEKIVRVLGRAFR
jgi:hypothetical protein